MALLDQLLGGDLLGGQLLGGASGTSSGARQDSLDLDALLATDPKLGLKASDVLSASDDGDTLSFSGIGDLAAYLSAPTMLGLGISSDSASASHTEASGGGGLLAGLL